VRYVEKRATRVVLASRSSLYVGIRGKEGDHD